MDKETSNENGIAIIAMNCRYPGIHNIEELWNVLENGIEVINPYNQTEKQDNFFKLNTSIEGSELFDAGFFGFTDREAEITDPQHRLFLECSWELLEKAGYDPFRYDGRIGLFASVSTSTYLIANLLSNAELINNIGDLQVMIGNDKDHLTSQVAYKLNLNGPCVTVQSSCSSSLVAVHFGCESLMSGQCDMVIAGGVTIKYPEKGGYYYKQGGLVSADGHLRAFDAKASGTLYSNGLGIVAMKRLEDALNEGDHIYAVIKGTAINSDGAHRVGYTAPGVDGQVAVITEAQAVAGVAPETISYIETHGSGTPLGDSIEIQALTKAFRPKTSKKGFCAIGSVKTNLGHVEMASGITGLIKASLALERKKLPPSLNFEEPNPDLFLHDSPFYVNTFLTEWEQSHTHPRRAGVSSFGLGGTNAHIILEEALQPTVFPQHTRQDILVISAKSEKALDTLVDNLIHYIESNSDISLNDISFTLKTGRAKFAYRQALVYQDRPALLKDILESNIKRYNCYADNSLNPIAVLFSHSAVLKPSDLAKLYKEYFLFKFIFDELAALFRRKGFDLNKYLDPLNDKLDFSEDPILLWLQNYTLTRLLAQWGVSIDYYYGTGITELVSVTLTKCLPIEKVIDLLCTYPDLENFDASEILLKKPFLSNISNGVISSEDLLSSGFWSNIKQNHNSLSEGVVSVLQRNKCFIIDLGNRDLKGRLDNPVLSYSDAISNGDDIVGFIQSLLASLWVNNYDIDWLKYYEEEKHNRVELPTYPFEKKSYWIEFQESKHPSLNGYSTDKNYATSTTTDALSHDLVENKLIKIWEHHLGTHISSLSSNFFELGGHSLLATQIVFDIRKQYEIDVPLQKFFEDPTIPSLARIINELLLIKEKDFEPLPFAVPDAQHRYDPFPLTDIQTAYWLGRNNSMQLGNISTHMYFENDGKGLDIEKFNAAFQKMMERHDMLRAVMLPDGTQKVLKEVPSFKIEVNDFQCLSSDELTRSMNEIREEMSHQVLDCYKWPLFDIKASKLPGDIVRLHISVDLLIADAWSLELLMNDLANEYHGVPHKNRSLDLSFRDYIIALKKVEQSRNYEKSKNYWLDRIKTLPPAPQLSLAKDPAKVTQPKFRRWKYVVKQKQWNAIKSFSRSFGVTPTTVLVSAFSEVLTLWSKKPHFTLNLTLFNRLPLHEDVNDIIGDFTSLTLLEVDFRKNDSFIAKVKSVQKQLLADIDYRYFSGTRVTRELLNEHKDPSRAMIPVIFTSILNQLESKWDPAENYFDEGPEEDDRYSISQTPQVWLDHQVIERNGSLHFNWDVVEELFPDGMIDEMFTTYCQLLEHFSSDRLNWETPWPISDNKEEFQYFKRLNKVLIKHSNQQPVPDGLLHDGFLAQVRKQPEKPAVCTKAEKITYKEIYNCAYSIAYQLQRYGVQPNELVAVVMSKGWEQVAASLGILMSGAAYLPIDATFPEERIQYLLQIGRVKSIIVQKNTDLNFKIPEGIDVLAVSRKDCEHTQPDLIVGNTKNTDLAYVIFTSGSTGTPKGVMIDHRGALNTIIDINSRFGVNNNDVVFGISSLCFDLSVYDIFGTLAAGGTLVLPDDDKVRDPSHWKELVDSSGVTIWNSVPALMKMLTDYSRGQSSETLASLRLVMMSGDWIPVSLPGEIKLINEKTQIVSLGGATEGSIWSILYPIEKFDKAWKSIPYGLSMVNQKVYVLNERMEVCPVGVKGELYIGGVGVALGYWRDEVKTSERFIINSNTRERLYCTGDMGRYMENGLIEFLGREDLQVKLGGFRIELGEIESVIRQHDYVKDAAVLINGQDNKQLIAYVKLDKEKSLGVSGLNDSDIILNPIKRMEFKLQQKSKRTDLQNCKAFHLESAVDKKAFLQRRSYRIFLNERISLKSFSRFLSCLSQCQVQNIPFPKYYYSSGGGLYPLQVYLYVQQGKIEGLEEGLYYYDSVQHRLLLVDKGETICEVFKIEQNKKIFESSGFCIFLVGQKDAIEPMYGKNESLRFMYLEAGIMTHLLEMIATDHNIGLCQMGKIDFDAIKPLLKLTDNHIYFHCLLGGKISEYQKTEEGLIEEFSQYRQISEASKSPAQQVSVNELIQKHVTKYLPHYMVPSRVEVLEEFPLTQNGKIDRKALLSQQQFTLKSAALSEELIAPKNDMENIIIQIWKELFPDLQFGIRDNFFDLGGSSISLVSVFRKLQETFGEKITMVDLFRYPTIEGIAALLNDISLSPKIKIEEEDKRALARKNAMKKLRNVNI